MQGCNCNCLFNHIWCLCILAVWRPVKKGNPQMEPAVYANESMTNPPGNSPKYFLLLFVGDLHKYLPHQKNIIYIQVEPGKPGAEVSKKKTISQRKNLPIECAQGDQRLRCPNRGSCARYPWGTLQQDSTCNYETSFTKHGTAACNNQD